MRGFPTIFFLVVSIIAVGGCRLDFDVATDTDNNPADADAASALDGVPGDAANGSDASAGPGTWGNAQPIASLDLDEDYDDPSLTGDLLEIYFNADSPMTAGDADIWKATRLRPDLPWGDPVHVAELSSTVDETTPEVAADGRTIFFARGDTAPEEEIFFSTRPTRDDPWTTPVLVAELSAPGEQDIAGGVTGDPMEIVLMSRRDVNDGDIYLASWDDMMNRWSIPQPIAEVNSNGPERNPFLDRSGLSLYFDADPDQDGDFDLYVATRPERAAPFTDPLRIDELVTTDDDVDPWVSPEGDYMVFTRCPDGANDCVLYEVSR